MRYAPDMDTDQDSYQVRPAEFADAQAIFELIKTFPDALLPRPVGDIVQNIDRFLIAEAGDRLIGTVSWAVLPEIGLPRHPYIEIKSLAV
jgi:N-acetylglutamate synthase-like GNAT family acetyltransferase